MAKKQPRAKVPPIPPTAVGDPNGHQRKQIELETDGDGLSIEGMSRLVGSEQKMSLLPRRI